jgi:formate dehydrogenase beta subunit
MTGCPFNVPKFSPKTRRVYKCTMCVDRVSVGLQPACIKACPTSCLQFGTKEQMLQIANTRVDQLKANGFMQAAVYDPPGVGGTSVVTVLAYGDKPELYGLPADPTIPVSVRLWKGPLKWIGNLAMLGGLLGVFAHYVRFGRKAHEAEPRTDKTLNANERSGALGPHEASEPGGVQGPPPFKR